MTSKPVAPTSGAPYLYIRKSRVNPRNAGVSWDVQVSQATALAAVYGDDKDLTVLSDWNVSGRKGAEGRPDYGKLLDAIASGRCRAIYSYNLSRLSRSLADLLALIKLADAKGVPVRLVNDAIDTSTASGRLLLKVLASVNEFTAEVASENVRDAIAARRDRGDHIGPAVFPDGELVVAAYRQAGSFTGAAKLLNANGTKTRNGKDVWYPSSVRVVVERVAPDLIVNGQPRGTKRAAPFLFFRLVRCWCGRTMTPARRASGVQAGYTAYRCTRGRLIPGHGKTTCPEAALVTFAKREMTRFRVPAKDIEMETEQREERAALIAKRAKLLDLVDTFDPEVIRTKAAAIDVELRSLDKTTKVIERPPAIRWDDASPEIINAILRNLWKHVQLDRSMRPTNVVWDVPDEFLVEAAAVA